MIRDRSPELPAPDADALAQSERLIEHIAARIRYAGGSIGFDEYMECALYTPGLGYYSGGAQKFGATGDFVTAPELSPIFSRCLARQVMDVWQRLDTRRVIEFGAGSGVMAADMLLEFEAQALLPERYDIVELSGELRERQRETIATRAAHLLDRVQWLDRLPESPVPGVVVGNEVLDAMPVKLFVMRGGEVMERCVTLDGMTFGFVETPADEALAAAVRHIETERGGPLPEGYVSEVNLALPGWFEALDRVIEAGTVLLIDYGYPRREYYLEERRSGTLICHYRHRAHEDVFLYPGLQDITANVDFTAVAEAAADAGFDVLGYTSQAYFLMGSGLDAVFAQMQGEDINQQLAAAQQVKQLTLPAEMGERFQVIALGKGIEPPLAGFAINDYRARL
ncbi:MAG TPA: SAM-dependent methyltransferase [Thioalkalivibrio sp.]|nr:SAM-dependent methyltransferase [Thioalkalivibrio sp.]